MSALSKLKSLTDSVHHAKDRLLNHSRYFSSWLLLEPRDYSSTVFKQEAIGAKKAYQELLPLSRQDNPNSSANPWVHPRWASHQKLFEKIIRDGISEYFLDDPLIRSTMVRRGWTSVQKYEEKYLLNCYFKNDLQHFCESRVGGPALESRVLRCSSNTLGHLFYLVRIWERHFHILSKPHIVIEFGGGYGSLARIYRKLIPNVTYVIIDLPEFLILQRLYLRMNFPHDSIRVHQDPPLSWEKGKIHLVPVELLRRTELSGDLFVSNFALSESTELTQKFLEEKRFLNCSGIYLTGQYSDLRNPYVWSPHQLLHEAVRRHYSDVTITDFHIPGNYELIGTQEVI